MNWVKPRHNRAPVAGEHWQRLDWPDHREYVVTEVTENSDMFGVGISFVVDGAPYFDTDETRIIDYGPQPFYHHHGNDWGAWIVQAPFHECGNCCAVHSSTEDYLCPLCRDLTNVVTGR